MQQPSLLVVQQEEGEEPTTTNNDDRPKKTPGGPPRRAAHQLLLLLLRLLLRPTLLSENCSSFENYACLPLLHGFLVRCCANFRLPASSIYLLRSADIGTEAAFQSTMGAGAFRQGLSR